MPGSVGTASPAATMPFKLAASFRREREFAVVGNSYRDGRSQRRLLVTLSRRRWVLTRRIVPADLGTLRTFF